MTTTFKYLKLLFTFFKKVIFAVLMGIGLSLGRKPVEMDKEDNKSIGSEK